MISIKARKQRKKLYNNPQHKKRRNIASHLEENLLLKYNKRSIPVIKGDTVKVIRGSFKGHEDKIARVNIKRINLEIEGITMTKADGNKIAKPIHPSNVIITKLNLTDKWRRKKLERGLSEETKKEIEKEAQEQIKEVEEEKKKIDEEKAKEEKEKEEEEEIKEEKPKKTEEPEKKEPIEKETYKVKTDKKVAKPKKTEKKPEKKVETDKKQTKEKVTKSKVTPDKKTPKKTTKKKEENK